MTKPFDGSDQKKKNSPVLQMPKSMTEIMKSCYWLQTMPKTIQCCEDDQQVTKPTHCLPSEVLGVMTLSTETLVSKLRSCGTKVICELDITVATDTKHW